MHACPCTYSDHASKRQKGGLQPWTLALVQVADLKKTNLPWSITQGLSKCRLHAGFSVLNAIWSKGITATDAAGMFFALGLHRFSETEVLDDDDWQCIWVLFNFQSHSQPILSPLLPLYASQHHNLPSRPPEPFPSTSEHILNLKASHLPATPSIAIPASIPSFPPHTSNLHLQIQKQLMIKRWRHVPISAVISMARQKLRGSPSSVIPSLKALIVSSVRAQKRGFAPHLWLRTR
jgi:hypothetical protein